MVRRGRPRLDTVFDVLSDSHRRRVLHELYESGPTDRAGVTPDDVARTDDDLATVTADLAHVHLPKLEAAGFVVWNRDPVVAHPGPRFDEIVPLFALLGGESEELPFEWP